MDLSKAFYYVSHDLSIAKLAAYSFFFFYTLLMKICLCICVLIFQIESSAFALTLIWVGFLGVRFAVGR